MKQFNQKRFTQLLKLLYSRFPGGGPFHIVTDDGNTETTFVVWCLMYYYNPEYRTEEQIEWLKEHEDEMRELMTMLLNIPEEKRHLIDYNY